jgi:hypothetical protein
LSIPGCVWQKRRAAEIQTTSLTPKTVATQQKGRPTPAFLLRQFRWTPLRHAKLSMYSNDCEHQLDFVSCPILESGFHRALQLAGCPVAH